MARCIQAFLEATLRRTGSTGAVVASQSIERLSQSLAEFSAKARRDSPRQVPPSPLPGISTVAAVTVDRDGAARKLDFAQSKSGSGIGEQAVDQSAEPPERTNFTTPTYQSSTFPAGEIGGRTLACENRICSGR